MRTADTIASLHQEEQGFAVENSIVPRSKLREDPLRLCCSVFVIYIMDRISEEQKNVEYAFSFQEFSFENLVSLEYQD